ncbi:MAG: alkaline phosphatase family protein [Gemmatimonadaceae bacterium]
MPVAKVLVLGIDAANPHLIHRWAEDGTLPNLASLMARGVMGGTRSVDGFFIGSTWPSFYTGVTPARHGVHYMLQLKPGTYEFHRPASGDFVKCAPFWTLLSRAGLRVAVLDVPLSRIDSSIEGIQVVEWGGHDAVFGFHAWPPAVEQTIASRFGVHPLGACCDAIRSSAQDYVVFTDALVHGVRAKANLTRHFLQQGSWDFFIQVFTEAHCAGHQCWHLHDVSHPGHDASIARVTGDPLRRVYAAIDRAIGDVLDQAGDALVMVFAAHGMAHWYGAQFLLGEILFRLGVASPPLNSPKPVGVAAAAMVGARRAWRHLPGSVRNRLSPLRNRLIQLNSGGDALPTIGVDASRSLCFAVNNGLAVGGIRLNLIGREPQGILEPGASAQQFCDQLAEDLLSIVDDRTGGPLVKRVLRTADLYSGEHLGDLPDLLVEWSDEAATGSTLIKNGAGAAVRARSPKIGVLEGVNEYGRSGEHRPEGFFVAAGPGVQQVRLKRMTSILDFAPTFAGLFDVRLPTCDGTPVPEIMESFAPR